MRKRKRSLDFEWTFSSRVRERKCVNCAALISQNFFDSGATGNSTFNELKRRGFSTAKPNVYRELDKLAELGFVTKEGLEGYKSVPGMKVNVKEVSVVA